MFKRDMGSFIAVIHAQLKVSIAFPKLNSQSFSLLVILAMKIVAQLLYTPYFFFFCSNPSTLGAPS